MKRKTNKLIIGIIFLAGLSLLLYPFVANQWNNYRQKQLISSYEQTVSEKDAAHEIDYDAELQKAEAYNEALLPSILPMVKAIQNYYMLYLILGLSITILVIILLRFLSKRNAHKE